MSPLSSGYEYGSKYKLTASAEHWTETLNRIVLTMTITFRMILSYNIPAKQSRKFLENLELSTGSGRLVLF